MEVDVRKRPNPPLETEKALHKEAFIGFNARIAAQRPVPPYTTASIWSASRP